MPIAGTILAYVGTGLLAVALAGIIARRRYRVWFFLALFLTVTLASTVMMLAWPARFYNSAFWQAKETALNFVRFAMALELAYRTFRAFPGALATVRLTLLIVLVATLGAVLAVSGPTDYESFLADLQPRVLNGSVWLFSAIAALILWYRLPVDAFHKAVLVGYVPYLLVFSLTINVLGALGRAGWERALGLLYVNQIAYLALLAHWARAAWRRVEVPTRPPRLGRRVREPVSV
jgi:hypothetical protein